MLIQLFNVCATLGAKCVVINSIAVGPATSKVRSNEKGGRVALSFVFGVQEAALADKALGEVKDPAQVVGSTVATDDVLGREKVAPLVALRK